MRSLMAFGSAARAPSKTCRKHQAQLLCWPWCPRPYTQTYIYIYTYMCIFVCDVVYKRIANVKCAGACFHSHTTRYHGLGSRHIGAQATHPTSTSKTCRRTRRHHRHRHIHTTTGSSSNNKQTKTANPSTVFLLVLACSGGQTKRPNLFACYC